MAIAAGDRCGHYEVLAPLGAGGMGEVYLAEDTRLRRKIALKLLPEEFTRDAARVRRFEQEARAASALNHPNILTIFDIGRADSTHYIATEFIDGQTLREQLKQRLAINAALDITIQIATALAAAHEAGIVHRDLKPENVMVRRDGIVKVLDFGLAKLTEQKPAVIESEAPTIAKINTDPGTVLGTANYMSPEQARGQEVDGRSDIFSLGVVLYEMVAGRAPFTGVNSLEVIGEILKSEPCPLKAVLPEVPAELQRIVTKALRKDREQRYQHVKDLLIDLKDLKQELEFETKLKGAHQFVVPPSGGSVEARKIPSEGGTTNAQPAGATNEAATARTTSSAEIILSEIKRHKRGVLASVAALLIALAALAYGIYRFATTKPSVARFQNVKLTRLTSLGNVGFGASISPDGKFIAYGQTDAGQHSLWTRAIATSSAVQIIPPVEAELFDPVFSPDGDHVYFRKREAPDWGLYQIPVLGGTPKRVLTRILSPITFSPDGRRFAFMRRSTDGTKSELVVVNADASNEQILATRQLSERFETPSWSPDGRIIAVTAISYEDGTLDSTLLGIAVKSGEITPLIQPGQSLFNFSEVAWLKDGSGLLLTANEKNSPNNQIWHVSYPGGQVRRLTNDLASYVSLSLTADSSALVTTQREVLSTLWLTPLNRNGRTRQLTFRGSNCDGLFGVQWTPDGRIVYASNASGNLDLWIMNSDGSNVRQLTDGPAWDFVPAVSPDGRYLLFISMRSGKLNLCRLDMDGSNLKQLTDEGAGLQFDFSPDGHWVIFNGKQGLQKISIDGGAAIPLSEGKYSSPAVAPDGKLIACYLRQSEQVVILPFAGGEPIKKLAVKLPALFDISAPRWLPDGSSLIHLDARQGGSNLWRLPLNGSPPQPLTNFHEAKPERIWNFDLSRDGKQLVIARGGQSADVVLISEVK